MKFKKDSPELQMLNHMVKRDLELLRNKLNPEKISDAIKMVDDVQKYLLLVEHAARHDVYDELGADVSEYQKFIKGEMDKIKIG